MNSPFDLDETQALKIVRTAVGDKVALLPTDDVDLSESGALDSMAWVDVLVGIESATGIRDFGNPWQEDWPRSIRTLASMIRDAQAASAVEAVPPAIQSLAPGGPGIAAAGWGYSLGSRTMTAEQIERGLALPLHKLRDGAAVESVCLAADAEDELALAQKAVETALDMANIPVHEIDFVVTTSATFLGFPSFAASLHSQLLLPETSGALDIGGACAGLIYSLSVARSLLSTSRRAVALVVASEVHSRRLNAPGVPGEFGGLFGDGACAFVLTNIESEPRNSKVNLRDFAWGCSGSYASSLSVEMSDKAKLTVRFKGEQLARAAVMQLDRIIAILEKLSARSRSEVDCFALHQPNPRIIEMLAEKAGISSDRIPLISRTSGNLGSATCGVGLCQAFTMLTSSREEQAETPLIFMAAMAPGMVWGGTYWN